MASHVFICIILLVLLGLNPCTSEPTKNIPAVLVFGDSTVDPGNNNFIPTIFKGNHPPYGREFPGQVATGRFSDGKLIPDFMASTLKIKNLIPPYLQPNLSDHELRTGVSFASAGMGYDDITSTLSSVIPVSKQVAHFKDYKEKLRRIVGDKEANRIISDALVVISAGTNDFIFNFYDLPTRRLQFNIGGYQDFLQNRLQSLVKDLYNVGCRTIVVAGLPPIGCLPMQIASKGPMVRTCVENQNSDSQVYNAKLVNLLPQLQKSLPGSKLFYADVYKPLMDLITTPRKFGLVESKRGCCGTGFLETGPLCGPITPLCPNPNNHVFFDSFHPTEFAYHYLADYLNKQILHKIIGGDSGNN